MSLSIFGEKSAAGRPRDGAGVCAQARCSGGPQGQGQGQAPPSGGGGGAPPGMQALFFAQARADAAPLPSCCP